MWLSAKVRPDEFDGQPNRPVRQMVAVVPITAGIKRTEQQAQRLAYLAERAMGTGEHSAFNFHSESSGHAARGRLSR
jgi:hypothetical protein